MMLFLSSLVGLSLGSFANVCIYRIPRKLSVVAPRSFCPHCGRTLAWYELIPVLSFLILRGRCRTCHASISIRYPFVEIAVAIVGLRLLAQYGPTLDALIKLLLFVLLLVIAVIDWNTLTIPNGLIIVGFVLGGLSFYLVSFHALLNAALSAVLASGFTLIVRLIGNFTFKKETMGLGDVKLAGLIGLFIGFEYFLVAVWLAAILGILYWAILHVTKRDGRDLRLPFGTFLSVVTVVVYLVSMSSIPLIL